MTSRDAITLDLDKNAVEVATGYGGVGVFLTIIGARKNRIITIALPRGKADELARLLRLASDASRFNAAKREVERRSLAEPMGGAPRRIQRRRTKGWRMREGTVYVGRPSRWGNPYYMPGSASGRHDGLVYALGMPFSVDSRAASVKAFRGDILSRPNIDRERWLSPLRGKDLACWCPLDQPCHADVLLELANR